MPTTLADSNNKDLALVLKGVGGFYPVYFTDNKKIITCKPRGKLRLGKGGILPGDMVKVSVSGDNEGMIEEIMPRKNQLIRPRIANIEQACLILAAKDPVPDWLLLDKMLVMSLYNKIKPLICFNKCDLLDEGGLVDIKNILSAYENAGFSVFMTSSQKGEGIYELYQALKGKLSVFAGASGVGKSSLLNALFSGLKLTTGEVSSRLKRGKHTTRHVEIWPLKDDIFVADTPGFSLLDLEKGLNPEALREYYPDFVLPEPCRFDGCLHDREPGCSVKDAIEKGELDSERYQRYLRLLNEIREREVEY